MSEEYRSIFKRTADLFRSTEPVQVEARSLAVPNLDTSPPTWADFNAVYNGTVSVKQALAIPAVAAAMRSVVTAISQLSMNVERQGQVIDSALVAQPDRNRTQSAFFKRTASNLFTTGNAYWRLYRNGSGAVIEMEALAPSRVRVAYDRNGKKFYEYSDPNGKQFTLSNNEYDYKTGSMNGQVEHIKLFELEDFTLGVGPIELNNEALYGIAELRWYTSRFLAESKRPSGIYSFTHELSDDEMAQAKRRIMESRTTGEPDVLDKGVSYQSIMVTAEQAGLAELNKHAVLEVARIFGIPPYKLASAVDGNSMTYQNIGQADMAWVRESLEQYLTAIEDAMTNVLPRGQVAQFDTDNWLRAATAIELVNPTEGSAPTAETPAPTAA